MVRIIGAGMAGLLAGAMMRDSAELYEKATSLPNNHHALLRFKKNEIGQHLNIPFEQVDVMKIVMNWKNPIADAMAYSKKCGGTTSYRSITTAQGNIEQRYIAPSDFIKRLGEMQSYPINYGIDVDRSFIEYSADYGPVISTMPMHALQKILGYESEMNFVYKHSSVCKIRIGEPNKICGTIYFPCPSVPITRATLTGQLLQVEVVENNWWSNGDICDYILPLFGLSDAAYEAQLVKQKYAKIVDVNDRERRKFIMWATDNFNVYSLGRFAVWKTNLLLDDVFHDVKKIMKMIGDGHNYKGRL